MLQQLSSRAPSRIAASLMKSALPASVSFFSTFTATSVPIHLALYTYI